MRRFVCAAMFLGCGVLQAQTPVVRPQFEVASVKSAVPQNLPPMAREFIRGQRKPGEIPMAGPDRVRIQNWALLDLIAVAYGVRTTQVSGPDWLGDQGFDVDATLAQGVPKEQLNGMLQSLLEERFGLKAHRTTGIAQGFALIVGKDGPKLKPAGPPPPSAPDRQLTPEEQKAEMEKKMRANLAAMQRRNQEKGATAGSFSGESWHSITMGDFAAQLVQLAGGPVLDETGLAGEYSVQIQTSSNADVPGGTIFDAIEKLGLKLDPRKVTVETVVVDQVSKMPTAN